MNKRQLIASLQLEPHLEGGYYRRTFSSGYSSSLPEIGERLFMSTIYYLLTDDSPIGVFHRNRSDIVHYWHQGNSLTYYLIDQRGQLHTKVLGPNLEAGEQLQLIVPGGVWKATQLNDGEFGLLSEAVCPGFDYADMALATAHELELAFPSLWQQQGRLLKQLCKS